jgi:DnaJ-class molecular chaperone
MEILNRVYRIIKSNIKFGRDERYDTVNAFELDNGEYEKQNSKILENANDDMARCYANLEIPCGSDFRTVKKAWKQMLKKYHPDLHSRDKKKQQTATRLTQGLTTAYNEIKKAHKEKLIH